MWRLRRIYATNIVSFRELDMEITPGVATMIFGQNLDNDNQKCNGSGKSSLIEAIAFGITGDTLRKVKVEDIINDKAEDASVQLMFENDLDGLVFTVDRHVSRKEPQRIECHLVLDGEEVYTDRTVQPSVTDYNRFILNELGITKDELYSSFILCKNHYESFLDASDKNKKEIINRFSNGVLVDSSIEQLDADIVPVTDKMLEANMEVTKVRGKIEAVSEELNNADSKKEEAAKNREAKIEEYKSKIAQKRSEIRENEELVEKAMGRRNSIRKLDERMQELEAKGLPIEEAYISISEELKAMALPPIKDYVGSGRRFAEEIAGIRDSIKSDESELSGYMAKVDELDAKMKELSDRTAKCKEKCTLDEKADRDRIAGIELAIESLKQEQQRYHSSYRKETVSLSELNKRLRELEVMLQGAITCPKCGHEFFFGKDVDVEDARIEKSKVEKDIKSKETLVNDLANKEAEKINEIKERNEECLAINENISKRYNDYRDLSNNLTTVSVLLDRTKAAYSGIKSKIEKYRNDIDTINGKIQNLNTSMFDELFNLIDNRMAQAKRYIDDHKATIKFAEGQIDQYQSAIEEVKSQKTEDIAIQLEASRRRYEKDLELASAEYEKIKARHDGLSAQRDLFVEFKSHLANQKIDAIAAVTNEFLELIGSDIRLQLEGFRRLKSGKLRDKITVKILRNGVDCGAFEKFSGGERARVYLANILAMQKITNSNCDGGKGLDLLIEDEILDCSDESGMMSFCNALNELGVTSMLVTQVPVSESYPHRLLVSKQNGESKINARCKG